MNCGSECKTKALFTIGYQGRSGEELVMVLKQHGVQKVIDVRANPFSHTQEFCGPALKQCLEQAGLAYTHAPELGNPFRGVDDNVWREKYTQHLTDHPELVEKALVRMGDRTCCLLCMEADFAQCHRTLAAEAIQRVWGNGLEIVHF